MFKALFFISQLCSKTLFPYTSETNINVLDEFWSPNTFIILVAGFGKILTFSIALEFIPSSDCPRLILTQNRNNSEKGI